MNTRSTLALLAALGLLATQPGASCVSDTSSDAGGSNTSSTSSRRDEPLDDRPASRAAIVKEGRGALEYTADADGTYWVQDVREENTIVTGRLHRGEKLRVVPDEDRVFVEGERVSKSNIRRDGTHRIYLLKDRRFDDRGGRNDRDSRDDRDGRDRQDRNDRPALRDEVKVPSGAKLLVEGKGRNLSAWVERDAKLFIYDADEKRVLATVPAKAGDRFVLAPEDGRVTLNGKRVLQREFSSRTNYRIYSER